MDSSNHGGRSGGTLRVTAEGRCYDVMTVATFVSQLDISTMIHMVSVTCFLIHFIHCCVLGEQCQMKNLQSSEMFFSRCSTNWSIDEFYRRWALLLQLSGWWGLFSAVHRTTKVMKLTEKNMIREIVECQVWCHFWVMFLTIIWWSV